jgi:hypothetical protein
MSRFGRSLTMQLGALFACVAVMVFSAVGFYLYQALATQLQERDDTDLVGRVLQIRHLLRRLQAWSPFATSLTVFSMLWTVAEGCSS